MRRQSLGQRPREPPINSRANLTRFADNVPPGHITENFWIQDGALGTKKAACQQTGGEGDWYHEEEIDGIVIV